MQLSFDDIEKAMETKKEPVNKENKVSILKAGDSRFLVKHAKNHISKNGNESIMLTLMVTDCNEVSTTVWDYLTIKYPPKLKHFWDAIGLDRSQQLDEDICVGKYGKCITEYEISEQFGTKLKIKDYYSEKKTYKNVDEEPFVDDDIPF